MGGWGKGKVLWHSAQAPAFCSIVYGNFRTGKGANQTHMSCSGRAAAGCVHACFLPSEYTAPAHKRLLSSAEHFAYPLVSFSGRHELCDVVL